MWVSYTERLGGYILYLYLWNKISKNNPPPPKKKKFDYQLKTVKNFRFWLSENWKKLTHVILTVSKRGGGP